MENKKNKTCCCAGVRPKSFIWDYYDKKQKMHKDYLRLLEYLIEKQILNGFTHFIYNGSNGADLDFACIVIRLKRKYPFIRLELVSAYPSNSSYKHPDDHKRYQKVLNAADQHTVLSPCFTPDCFEKQNRYMIDKSQLLFVIWDGRKIDGINNLVRYAEKQKKEQELLLLPPDPDKDFDAYFHYLIEGGLSLAERKKKDLALKKLKEKLFPEQFEQSK